MMAPFKRLFDGLSRRTVMPFSLEELDRPDQRVEGLFRKYFGCSPPAEPRHFVAVRAGAPPIVAAYVHHTPFEPGVFLVGGLCVDSSAYRLVDAVQRRAIARNGSLSRWLLTRSIAALGPKRAVFAYTGDIRSRRDCLALGFVAARDPYLIVQWHEEPLDSRENLVERVSSLGPF